MGITKKDQMDRDDREYTMQHCKECDGNLSMAWDEGGCTCDDRHERAILNETLRDILQENELLTIDGHDSAIIGVVEDTLGMRVLYDTNKITANLVKGGMTFEEAVEYFDFNILGAYVGKNGPMYTTVMLKK